MRAKTLNEIEFNFSKNPTDRFRARSGPSISRPASPNPRKDWMKGGEGLNDEEQELVDKYNEKLQALQDEQESIHYQIQDLEQDLKNLTTPDFSPEEIEEFYAEVQTRYGFDALDILNSGSTKEEKLKRIDALNPSDDLGIREFEDLLHNYDYYHPDEPDEEEIAKIEKEIKKLRTLEKERKNTSDKLQTKIYNIETY